ncbi:hypothetical protein EG329_010081 [Mollisiaceae sp. DMI_Dod_QoI]|nr:hypothetical protein EG329_010081 [Helotiales sp. DMI_Dod_QoI]
MGREISNADYKRILSKYRSDTEREYAAKILSLVVFARRRLTVNEITEAVWITSDEAGQKNAIFPKFIKRLFVPLVVIDHDPNDADNDFCRLFHSAVKSFLLQHRDILCKATGESSGNHMISEDLIGRACLSYLRMDKYSTLLRKASTEIGESWTTFTGENISTHHLLRYSSKYWDKHLDDVKESPVLCTSVEEFLKSRNFITTLQLQSLFVESHFGIYIVTGRSDQYQWLKRVFPGWFTETKGCIGHAFKREYRTFVSVWRWFLHRPTCCSQCQDRDHAGEIDKVLWGALGPQSFLSGSPGRYMSFMLANDAAPKKRLSRVKSKICMDTFSFDGKEVAIVHFTTDPPAQSTMLIFQVEIWRIRVGSAPTLKSQQCISINSNECHWELYTRVSVGYKTLIPVRFSPELSFLRLGSQIFFKNNDGVYVPKPGLGLTKTNCAIPWYFEDFSSRGQHVALVSRQKPPKALRNSSSAFGKEKPEDEKKEPDLTEDEKADESDFSSVFPSRSITDEKAANTDLDSTSKDSDSEHQIDSEAESEAHQIDSESSSESIELDSDDESWSEGYSDIGNDMGISSNQDDDSTSSSLETESYEDSNSDARPPVAEFASFCDSDDGRVHFNSDSGDERGRSRGPSDDESPIRRYFPESNIPRGMITILDFSKKDPMICWQYRHPLPIMLYGSTPAFHPTKSLAVWPLSEGDILFVDFEQKTHFIRKARVTSKKSRHVFIKPQFSADGVHLHLASLEAQSLPRQGNRETSKDDSRLSLRISLFIATHRLSVSNTTRVPPTLIHHVNIILGAFKSISVSQLPFSLTWTKEFLYVVCSSMKLRMFRIALFPPQYLLPHIGTSGDEPKRKTQKVVTVPKNEIFLPDSARVREVQYFPPDDGTSQVGREGTILIGSLNYVKDRRIKEMLAYDEDTVHIDRLPNITSPPIGLFVTEEDLGGWITEEGRIAELEKGRGRNGGLERKIERFDADDDCDIEPYLR